MPKVVINACYGPFSISRQAAEFMAKRGNARAKAMLADKGTTWYGFGSVDGFEDEFERDCPDLVAAVERLGRKANGKYAELRVVDVPDDVEWEISEYDGYEHVAEKHRTWY